MSTINLHATTTASPEQFLAALTDFGPGRSKLFGNSTDDCLEVHVRAPQYVEVTEGSAGIWERQHYDLSDPDHIAMVTTDSNVWGGNSGHTYTFTRQPDGATTVDAVVVRQGKNLAGRILGFALGTIGKGILANSFANTIKAIEARSTTKKAQEGAHRGRVAGD
jgi:hypothetical protein